MVKELLIAHGDGQQTKVRIHYDGRKKKYLNEIVEAVALNISRNIEIPIEFVDKGLNCFVSENVTDAKAH